MSGPLLYLNPKSPQAKRESHLGCGPVRGGGQRSGGQGSGALVPLGFIYDKVHPLWTPTDPEQALRGKKDVSEPPRSRLLLRDVPLSHRFCQNFTPLQESQTPTFPDLQSSLSPRSSLRPLGLSCLQAKKPPSTGEEPWRRTPSRAWGAMIKGLEHLSSRLRDWETQESSVLGRAGGGRWGRARGSESGLLNARAFKDGRDLVGKGG